MIFRGYKFSRIHSYQIFNGKNFCEQIKIWRNLEKFVLAKVRTFKVADFYWHLLFSSTNSISSGIDVEIQVSFSLEEKHRQFIGALFIVNSVGFYNIFWLRICCIGNTHNMKKLRRHFSLLKRMQAGYLV